MAESSNPAMSVVLLAQEGFEGLRRTIRHLRAQDVCDQLEIVIVVALRAVLGPTGGELDGFWGHRVVEYPLDSGHEAQSAGVRACSGPVVVFAEDHCYPQPGWASALRDAHQRGYVAVGPAFLNANPEGLTSWAEFLLSFGTWAVPETSREVDELAGHNVSYQRETLLAYGAALGSWLDQECFLHADLKRAGGRIYLEAGAVTSHLNASTLAGFVRIQFHGLRCYASRRVEHEKWGIGKRIAYVMLAPLIPPLRLRRLWPKLRTAGGPRRLIPGILPPLALGLIAGSIGEACAYAFGPGRSEAAKGAMEYGRERFISKRDRRALPEQPDLARADGP